MFDIILERFAPKMVISNRTLEVLLIRSLNYSRFIPVSTQNLHQITQATLSLGIKIATVSVRHFSLLVGSSKIYFLAVMFSTTMKSTINWCRVFKKAEEPDEEISRLADQRFSVKPSR